MKSGRLFLIVFILLFSISFASAVWYNPFSWFEKEVQMSETSVATCGGECSASSSDFCFPRDSLPDCISRVSKCICRYNYNEEKYLWQMSPSGNGDCDGDGVWKSTACGKPGNDCDDDNPDIWEKKFLYSDFDGDGYAKDTYPVGASFGIIDASDRTEFCIGSSYPEGYVESIPYTSLDCDDNNKDINPGVSIEVCNNNKDDNCNTKTDCGDNYCFYGDCNPMVFGSVDVCSDGEGSDVCECSPFLALNLGVGDLRIADLQQCQEQLEYYYDCDGDEKGNILDLVLLPRLLLDSIQPIIEIDDPYYSLLPSFSPSCRLVLDSSDCDDNNKDIWQLRVAYEDKDGDGDGIIPPVAVCSGYTIPQGYVNNALDCEDNNQEIKQNAGYPINPASPLDDLCNKCGSTTNYAQINPITGEPLGGISIGEKQFEKKLNTKEMRNCYWCNPDTKRAEFIENNEMGDNDCFWCTPSGSYVGANLDPTIEPAGLYYNGEGKLTTEARVLRNPLPHPPQCDCIQLPDGSYNYCCYINNILASSDSLKKQFLEGFDMKEDCKTCDWIGGSYKFRKPAGQQAELINASEDPTDSGGNCSYCGYDVAGVWGLQPDTTDSRFDQSASPIIPGGEPYLCKQCDPVEPYWIVNDSDLRVHGDQITTGDKYIETTCKKCYMGDLKNESDRQFSFFNPTDTTNLEDFKCCGGLQYNKNFKGCCSGPNEDSGIIFDVVAPYNKKCCLEQEIEAAEWSYWFPKKMQYLGEGAIFLTHLANPLLRPIQGAEKSEATLRNLRQDYLYWLANSGKDFKASPIIPENYLVVEKDNVDYCSGNGFNSGSAPDEGVDTSGLFGQGHFNGVCEPCGGSPKGNTLPGEAISSLGVFFPDVVGFVEIGTILGGWGYLDLPKMQNLDVIIGLRGFPRFNRVCFKRHIDIPIIPGPGFFGETTQCGECNPKDNSKETVDVTFRLPFSSWPSWKFWKSDRKVEKVSCNTHHVENDDLTKFATAWVSGSSDNKVGEGIFTFIGGSSYNGKYNVVNYDNSDVAGCYYCSPAGQCEVQDEMIPGLIRYSTKEIIATGTTLMKLYNLLKPLKETNVKTGKLRANQPGEAGSDPNVNVLVEESSGTSTIDHKVVLGYSFHSPEPINPVTFGPIFGDDGQFIDPVNGPGILESVIKTQAISDGIPSSLLGGLMHDSSGYYVLLKKMVPGEGHRNWLQIIFNIFFG